MMDDADGVYDSEALVRDELCCSGLALNYGVYDSEALVTSKSVIPDGRAW